MEILESNCLKFKGKRTCSSFLFTLVAGCRLLDLANSSPKRAHLLCLDLVDVCTAKLYVGSFCSSKTFFCLYETE